jgi:hypothetical protein
MGIWVIVVIGAPFKTIIVYVNIVNIDVDLRSRNCFIVK